MRAERPHCETTKRCVLPPLGMMWVARTRCMFCNRVIVDEVHIAPAAPTQALEPPGELTATARILRDALTIKPDERTPVPLTGPRTNPAVRIRFETVDGMRYYVREAVAHDGLDFTSYKLADCNGFAHKLGEGWLVIVNGEHARAARMQVQFLEEWLQELINLQDKAQPAQPGRDAGNDDVPTKTV